MADDARTEARRRIAAALRSIFTAHGDTSAVFELGADAVLVGLFPKVDWYGIAFPDDGDPQSWIYRRRLQLTGPVELDPEHPDPVVPEEPAVHDPACQMLVQPPPGFPFATFSCNCDAVSVPPDPDNTKED